MLYLISAIHSQYNLTIHRSLRCLVFTETGILIDNSAPTDNSQWSPEMSVEFKEFHD